MRTLCHLKSLLRGSVGLVTLLLLSCGGADPDQRNQSIDEAQLDHRGPGRCGKGQSVLLDWREQAPLPQPRSRHDAALLPDGRVIVTGGAGPFLPSAPTPVLLYNPATDTWTTHGYLPEPVNSARAAVLPDGRVLFSPGGALYDPRTGTSIVVPLTPVEAMYGYRFSGSTLTVLANGKVLRTGGSEDFTYLKEAVLYDPDTNTWSSAGTLSATRSLHTATRLLDGRVLVVGGYTLTASTQRPAGRTSVEIYDPITGIWTAAASTQVPRMQHTATLLPSGRVLVIGGQGRIWDGEGEDAEVLVYASGTAEIYDPERNTWTLTAPPSQSYGASHTATLTFGQVLAIDTASAEVFSELLNRWFVIPAPHPRRFHSATALRDGSVLVAGGSDGTVFINAPDLASVERLTLGCGHPAR